MPPIFADIYAGVAEVIRQWRNTSVDLTRIETAIYYIKAVSIARMALMGLTGLIVLAGFFTLGVALVETAVVMALPPGAKVPAACAFGILDIAAAAAAFFFIFSQKRWMELTKSKSLLEKATNHQPQHA